MRQNLAKSTSFKEFLRYIPMIRTNFQFVPSGERGPKKRTMWTTLNKVLEFWTESKYRCWNHIWGLTSISKFFSGMLRKVGLCVVNAWHFWRAVSCHAITTQSPIFRCRPEKNLLVEVNQSPYMVLTAVFNFRSKFDNFIWCGQTSFAFGQKPCVLL